MFFVYLMGVLRNIKRGVILGGLVGALAGSQYGSVREAYKDVLETDISEKEIDMDHVKDHKKNYKDKETYIATLEEIQNEYDVAKNKLKEYTSLPDSEKKKEAFKDVRNYGHTIKEIDVGFPTSKDGLEGAAKGGVAGAVAGSVLLVGLGARNSRKKKKRKDLSSKLGVFLGLLAGGVGLSLTVESATITGNVIGGLGSTGGIIGILLLIIGIVASFNYFREH